MSTGHKHTYNVLYWISVKDWLKQGLHKNEPSEHLSILPVNLQRKILTRSCHLIVHETNKFTASTCHHMAVIICPWDTDFIQMGKVTHNTTPALKLHTKSFSSVVDEFWIMKSYVNIPVHTNHLIYKKSLLSIQ